MLKERDTGPRNLRKLTFDEVIDARFADGCPKRGPEQEAAPRRGEAPNTVANARKLLGTSIRPVIGHFWIDRLSTQRLEKLFADVAERGYDHEHDRPQLERPDQRATARGQSPRSARTPGRRSSSSARA